MMNYKSDKLKLISDRISEIDRYMENTVVMLETIDGESPEYSNVKSNISDTLLYRKQLIIKYQEVLDTSI